MSFSRFNATIFGIVLLVNLAISVQAGPTTQASTTSPDDLSRLSPTQRISLARSLVEQAIATKTDSDKVKRLLVRASEIARNLPPATTQGDIQNLVVKFGPETDISNLMAAVTTKTVEKRIALSKRVTQIESHSLEEAPFTAMADNGKGFVLPVPFSHDSLLVKEIEVGGKKIHRSESINYFVSPDETRILLEHCINTKPLEVLEIDTGKILKIDAPKEFEGHYLVFPLVFVEWSKDSNSFVCRVEGTFVKNPDTGNSAFMAYRELWRFDAKSGKGSQIERQEKKWEKKLKWD